MSSPTLKHIAVWPIAVSLAIAIFCVPPIVTNADTPDVGMTPDEQRLKEAMLQYNGAVTAVLEAEIEDNKQRRARGRISAQVYGQQVKWLPDKLNRFRKQPYQVPQLYLWSIKDGDIGPLTGNISSTDDPEENRFRVFQVIDGNNMLIESHDGITANEANVAIRRVQKIAWVAGVETAGVIDDSFIKLGQIFEVKGTKQYATAGGATKTVFMISPFAIQDPQPLIDKLAPISAPTPRASTPAKEKWKTEFRTWRDSTRKFTVKAKYSNIISGNVVLLTEDGHTMQVPIERLSDADRKLLQ